MNDRWIEVVEDYLRTEAAAMVVAIDETTKALIRTVVAAGVADGLGAGAVATQLREAWPEIARYRAERIARTEVLRASNHGALAGAIAAEAELGEPLVKVWLAADDSRTRHTHANLDETAVTLDGLFDVGGTLAPYPGAAVLPPDQSVNCRCALAYELAADRPDDEA